MAADGAQPQIRSILTRHCGEVDLHILGDCQHVRHKPVFLTVHDFGANATSFYPFLFHPSMLEVRRKSVWFNFELPGQGRYVPELRTSFKFPSLDDVAEDLSDVLHQFNIGSVVGFGEGAGANILTRLAMAHPTKVSGLVLIHPTATSAGFLEWAKDKLMTWRELSPIPTAEEYLVMYKFGNQIENSKAAERQRLIEHYITEIRYEINHKNMLAYMEAFHKRDDFSNRLRFELKCDTLVICGSKGSFLHTVRTMHSKMNPQNSAMVMIDDVADVLSEAPDQVIRSLLLFCKGLGLLTTVYTPAERASTVSSHTPDRNRLSMQEADMPRSLSPSRSPVHH